MEASSFRLQDDPAAGVVASDSFSACVERLRAEHGLDHWLLKAKEGPLSYAFNQPDTDAQNELFVQQLCDDLRRVGYIQLSIPSQQAQGLLREAIAVFRKFFNSDPSHKAKFVSPSFYDLGNNTQLGWMDEEPQLLSVRRESTIPYPWHPDTPGDGIEKEPVTQPPQLATLADEGDIKSNSDHTEDMGKDLQENTAKGQEKETLDVQTQDGAHKDVIPLPPPLLPDLLLRPRKHCATPRQEPEGKKFVYVSPKPKENPTHLEKISLALFQLLEDIATLCMGFIARDLGLSPNEFIDLHCEPFRAPLEGSFSASVMLINYFAPAQQAKALGLEDTFGPIAMGAHTDRGLITVAPNATHPGLQVFNFETCQWEICEEPDDDSHMDYTIFVGDTMQHLTADYYRALLHRVAPGTWEDNRISIPFQLRARHNSVLSPADLKSSIVGPVHGIDRIYRYPVTMPRFLRRPAPLPIRVVQEAVQAREKRQAEEQRRL